MKKKMLAALAGAAIGALALTGCANDADVASHNLSKDADNFKIPRRVVFFNGITDKYLLTMEGYCSINADVGESGDNQLEVTCKTDGGFKKHYLGLSDNVTYLAEQLDPADVSSDHYKLTFKPTAIIPDIENTSGD